MTLGRPWPAEMIISTRVQEAMKRIGLYTLALGITLFIVFPLYLMVAVAFQSPSTLFGGGNVNVLITEIAIENFQELLDTTNTVQYLTNSLIVTGGSTILSTAIAVSAGYGLTRFEFRGKSYAARAVLLTYMFSPIVLAVPLYVVFYSLGILNTYFALSLALAAISAPFSIWLMWQYFQTVPLSLEENAWISGAHRLRAVWDIVLPVARPGYISAAIFAFAVAWNDFTMGQVLLSDSSVYTLTVGSSLFLDRANVGWGETMAVSVIMTIPPLIVVLFLQNYLLQGFNIGDIQ